MAKRKQYDTHHLYPRSRYPEFKRENWNRKWMKRSVHAAWHTLTGNRTPIEAIVHLVREFVPQEAKDLEPDALEELRRILG